MSYNLFKKFLFKHFIFKYSKILAKLNLKPQVFEISKDEKCLCLTPHADDESIGMGGFLSKFGKNFDVILLTDGKKGIKNLQQDEVIKIRENEFSKAMDLAKVSNFKFLKVPDKHLSDGFELFKTIDISRYDYIFLPNIIDQHPDHKAVSLLLNESLKTTKTKSDLKICFYEVWSPLGFVNYYENISDVIENKKNMINCYTSQTEQKDYVYYSKGLNSYRGMFKDIKFAEAFCVVNTEDFKKIVSLYQ